MLLSRSLSLSCVQALSLLYRLNIDITILDHTCRTRLSVSMTQFSPMFIQWLLYCPYNSAHESSRQDIMYKCSKHSMEVAFAFASILTLPGISLVHAKITLNDFIEC